MEVIKAWAVPLEKGGRREAQGVHGLRGGARPITYFSIYRSNGRWGRGSGWRARVLKVGQVLSVLQSRIWGGQDTELFWRLQPALPSGLYPREEGPLLEGINKGRAGAGRPGLQGSG